MWRWSRIYQNISFWDAKRRLVKHADLGLWNFAPPPGNTMLQFLLAYLGLFWCVRFLVSLWVCVCLRPNASSGTHTWYLHHVFIRQSRVLCMALCSVLDDHAIIYDFAYGLSVEIQKLNQWLDGLYYSGLHRVCRCIPCLDLLSFAMRTTCLPLHRWNITDYLL